jgi:hypothetical protein
MAVETGQSRRYGSICFMLMIAALWIAMLSAKEVVAKRK